MNFVTAGLVPITGQRLSKRFPNHPGEGDDVPGGADHNDEGEWNQPPT